MPQYIDRVTGNEATIFTPPEDRVLIRRQPEANVHAFALGHYEQMIMAKALAYALTLDTDYALSPNEATHLASLQHIFDAHGTVTIIRSDPED